MKKVLTTKSTSDNRIDGLAVEVDLAVATNVRKHVSVAQSDQNKLAVVCMSREIFKSVQRLAKQTKRLVLISIAVVGTRRATLLNTFSQGRSDVLSGCGPVTTTLIRNVIFHAGLGINLEFSGVNRTTESPVVSTRILALSVALGVVNMLLSTVDAKSVTGDLKLLSTIAKLSESHNPKHNADQLRANVFAEGADINCLRVITEPVAKVDPLNSKVVELLSALEFGNEGSRGHSKGSEGVLNVSVSKVDTFDSGQRWNVSSAKAICTIGHKHNGD